MKPRNEDFRDLRTVDDRETHERLWQPTPDPELVFAGRLEILSAPDSVATVIILLPILVFGSAMLLSEPWVVIIGLVALTAFGVRLTKIARMYGYRFTDADGIATEATADYRTRFHSSREGEGRFASVSEDQCDARTRTLILLARSVLHAKEKSVFKNLSPRVGDELEVFLTPDCPESDRLPRILCVTFGRFQRIVEDRSG